MRDSIQGKLGLALTVGITAMWLLATGISSWVIAHELEEAHDESLARTALGLLSIAALEQSESASSGNSLPESRRTLALPGHDQEALPFVVRDQDGLVVLASHDTDLSLFDDTLFVGFHSTDSYRIYGERSTDLGLTVQIAEPSDERREALQETMVALFSPLPLLVPLTLFLVWSLVKRSMRSVARLRLEIETRGGSNLDVLQGDGLPRELRPIAEAVNRLMQRLRRAIESERTFATHSAHELRTPVAGALAQVQRLIAKLPDGENRDQARRVEDSLRGMSRLSEKLMQLARAESGFLLGDSEADRYAIIEHVILELEPSSSATPPRLCLHRAGDETLAAGGVDVYLDEEPAYYTRLDSDGLAILLRNLFENALKHSPPGSPVDIIIEQDRRTLRVINDGPVLDDDTLHALRERFRRGSTTAEGAGLGMAIVDALLQNSGLEIRYRSPARSRASGFEASVGPVATDAAGGDAV